MRQHAAGAVLAASTISLMALAGAAVAQADSAPNVVGQKYSDATSAISGAGLTAVVSTIVGDQKARSDCLVTNQVSRTEDPPENSSGSEIDQVLVSLDCDDGEASATTPGFSAGSPEGRAAAAAAAAAKEAAAKPAAS
jgi:hypothetical protein